MSHESLIATRRFVALALVLSLGGCSTRTVIYTSMPLVRSSAGVDRIQKLSLMLLESCSFENDETVANQEIWDQHAEKHGFRFKFSPPRQVYVLGSPLAVSELMIPVSQDSAPPHLFLRADGRIRAFCKYACATLTALQEELGWGQVKKGNQDDQ